MKHKKTIKLVGVPTDIGSKSKGCLMGPDALRTAGLITALTDLGCDVEDLGNLTLSKGENNNHPNAAIQGLGAFKSLIELFAQNTHIFESSHLPILLGGDHAMAAGVLPNLVARANNENKEQFVLWLDAHPDLHTLDSTSSGNLHGTPMAYSTGEPGFETFLPPLKAKLKPENICMMGIRSVDPAEGARITNAKIQVHDMRAIDERGVAAPLKAFLERVRAVNGHLHVSFDIDFLDPEIAPAVGTTVPGGATFREAHLIMEMLHDSALVTSLDIVELNPFLDERGRTAKLITDLVASLFGRRVLDRSTRSY